MKRSILMKLAMTFTVMLFVSSAFAQITLTIKNADGTPASLAVVYSLNSSTGVESIKATALVTGVASWGDAAGKLFYLIRSSANDAWASYSINYDGVGPVAATIYLGTVFNPTLGSYSASRTSDMITIGKTMPFWVHPSPMHNPAYSAPTGAFATVASIIANLQSSFVWVKTGNGTLNDNAGAPDVINNNYVEVNTTGATDGNIIALEVTETPAAAYGGCAATPVYFNFEAINPPHAKITNAAIATYKVNSVAVNTIVASCTPTVATNVTVALDNAKEVFPYYMRLTYTAQNGHINSLDANDIILDAPVLTFPAGKEPIGMDAINPANVTTNPFKFALAAGNLYPVAPTFATMNDKITVYKYDLGSWNASVSRKSDYKALSAPLSIATSPYTWYTGGVAGTSGQPAADVTVAYIIVFPKPVTGPIYHIANSWGII